MNAAHANSVSPKAVQQQAGPHEPKISGGMVVGCAVGLVPAQAQLQQQKRAAYTWSEAREGDALDKHAHIGHT